MVGASLVVGYALQRAHGTLAAGDTLMLAAVVVCGLGYAEGGRLARSLGSWQTICWALVLAWPLLLLPTWWTRPHGEVASSAWLGFAYLSVISMFLAFFAWYRGLALGGIARIGQVQLLQPFFTLFLAWAMLGEALPSDIILIALGVAITVALGRRLA
jgi:drug/metabolite transporter (DMT)-like permease